MFIVIGGVSASDVADVSNNPSNDHPLSDSVSEESSDDSTNQLSNEAISSLSQSTDDSKSVGFDDEESECIVGPDDSKSVGFDDEESEGIVGPDDSSANLNANSLSSSDNTASNASGSSSISSNTNSTSSKTATSVKLSSTQISANDHITVTLKDNGGKALKGKKIIFTVNNKVYTKTTNSEGQAKLTLSKAGTYKINVNFKGDSSFAASKLSSTVKVSKSSTRLDVLNSTVPRTTSLVVILKNKNGVAVSGKKIIFKDLKSKKTYQKTTDSKGRVRLVINSKKLNLRIIFAGDKNFGKSRKDITVNTVRCPTKFVASPKNLKCGENYVANLKKISNYPMKNVKVYVKIANKNKSYTLRTNSEGKVFIPMEYVGTLKVKLSYAGNKTFIKSSTSVVLNVSKGTTSLEDSGYEVGKGSYYYITLKNSGGKALANKKVKITFNKKTFTKKTNSKGKISLAMNYKKGLYSLVASYSGDKCYKSSKLRRTIKIGNPSISISKIVSAAKNLKTRVGYIDILNKDYTVVIDKKEYTMDEFAYLMAGAIANIKSGSNANVKIKDLSNNYKSSGSKINGKLSQSEYLKLAKTLTKYVNSKKRIPNSINTKLGKMEADLYIYTFANILDSYSKNKKLPSSVKVKTDYVRGGYSTSLSQSGKILNHREIFNSASFAKYLKTGGKSALNDAIRNKAKSITKGLKSPMAKAVAIFRYVRDDVTYSFYTNSLKGASGTLRTKSGNCCDKANLIVAMCRSVGVYARYSHAQGCKFQSGLYTGHVWAQVYDTKSQTWLTADATSHRNEVGKIKNWNYKSHYRDHNYVQIPF